MRTGGKIAIPCLVSNGGTELAPILSWTWRTCYMLLLGVEQKNGTDTAACLCRYD